MDDLLCRCKDAKANDDLLAWAQKQYGELKTVTAKRGKCHDFLGMTFDFGIEIGTCHVIQENHIKNMLEVWLEEPKEHLSTPAGQDLFERGAGGLLSDTKRELFHTVVTKGIFVTKRSRPDISPTTSVISDWVRDPNKEDWRKCRRMLDYLE